MPSLFRRVRLAKRSRKKSLGICGLRKTTIDDQMVRAVGYIITNHRDILIRMVDWTRSGREPPEAELLAMTQDVRTSPTEYGSLMMLLYVVTTLYQILRFTGCDLSD